MFGSFQENECRRPWHGKAVTPMIWINAGAAICSRSKSYIECAADVPNDRFFVIA
jgi:hypothetical protein